MTMAAKSTKSNGTRTARSTTMRSLWLPARSSTPAIRQRPWSAPATAPPSARRQQSRPPLPVCPARRLRISTSSSWTLTMAAGSTKARSAMARWSTTSPSTPIPVRSSNGTWNPSTTKQITNVRFFFFYSTRHYSTSSISISGVAPYFPTR